MSVDAGRGVASIREVARVAGVSITTVSHALHGTGYVAAKTRAHVHTVAQRVGYRPNQVARGLRTGRTMAVGMLVSHLRNPLVASYVEGAEAVLGEAGYGLVLASTHLVADQEERALDVAQQGQADGLIVAAASPWLLGRLGRVAAARPVALINAHPDAVAADGAPSGEPGAPGAGAARRYPIVAAVVDEERTGHVATAHLLSLGHRRVALVQRGVGLWSFRQRLTGYRRALEEAGIAFDPALVFEHEPPESDAVSLVARLRAAVDTPTAAYVAHNLVALRLVEALQELDVRVPDQLALVVSAAEDWTRVVRPRLSTVEIPGRELGAAAARLLLAALGRGAAPPVPVDSHGRHRYASQAARAAAAPAAERPGAAPPDRVQVFTAPLAVRESSGVAR